MFMISMNVTKRRKIIYSSTIPVSVLYNDDLINLKSVAGRQQDPDNIEAKRKFKGLTLDDKQKKNSGYSYRITDEQIESYKYIPIDQRLEWFEEC